jgi:hypothetical protein
MYKELVISIIIVVLIFALDTATQQYTDKSINETIDKLSELKENIRSGNTDGNLTSDSINSIYDMWLKYHEKLVLYIEHDEIEKVETNFVTCISFIESESYDSAIAELEKTVFVLQHISDKYEFNLENIF